MCELWPSVRYYLGLNCNLHIGSEQVLWSVYQTDLELSTPWLIILLGTGTACTVLNLLILIAISLVGVSGSVSHCLARVISMISNRFDITMLSIIN